MDDVRKHSPEQILLWARRTVLYIDVEIWENDIKHIEEIEADKLTDEDKEGLEHAKKMVQAASEELQIVVEKLDKLEAAIANNENAFADKIAEIEAATKANLERLAEAEKETPNTIENEQTEEVNVEL